MTGTQDRVGQREYGVAHIPGGDTKVVIGEWGYCVVVQVVGPQTSLAHGISDADELLRLGNGIIEAAMRLKARQQAEKGAA